MNKEIKEVVSNMENERFMPCRECGEQIDLRQLDDVAFHETHKERADIQYSGSVRMCVHCAQWKYL